MSKLIRFFILLGFFAVPASGQTPEARAELGAKLEATTSILDQKACIDESGSDFQGRKTWSVRVDLVMSVKYANTGQRPIILDKGSGTIGGQRISTSEQNAHAKKYEYDSRLTWMMTSINPRKEDRENPSDTFIILNPGEHYEKKTETRLLIGQPEQYNLFSSAVYFLTFGMWTEDGTLSDANDINELRTRWKKHGYLWVEGVTTQPMPIQLPKLENIKSCN